ncbi:MAG TPA: Fic family protein [Solirubrobacteraceae bacterium]
MLFRTPKITKELRTQLDGLDLLRGRLGAEAGGAGLWLGSLRRQVRASSAESSISIEGFHVPEEEAAKLVAGEELPGTEDESRMALACYARAMNHVRVMASDPHFRWLDRVILDLHFDACDFQRDKSPGLLREGPIGVTGGDGSLAYRGPDADEVPDLIAELVDWLQEGDLDAPAVVRAAMAHLNLVSIHPFRDGNGRISRIVQSLVLAREGLMSPEFSSIEEYLGAHTPAYYAALRALRDRYQPERDATGWVAFCVEAHLVQARQRLTQIEQAGKRWRFLENLVEDRGWSDRLVIALEQSLFHGADRSSYATEAGISSATASADLRRLLDAGLVVRQSLGRMTRYTASDALHSGVRDALP